MEPLLQKKDPSFPQFLKELQDPTKGQRPECESEFGTISLLHSGSPFSGGIWREDRLAHSEHGWGQCPEFSKEFSPQSFKVWAAVTQQRALCQPSQ